MSQGKPQDSEPPHRQSRDLTRLPTKDAPEEPFAKFDNRIAKASDRIFPRQPYLVTIPSEKPFHRHANDQTRWYLYAPFSKKEEQLQYMSFLLHQGDDEVLMRVDGTRIDEDGRLLAPAQSPRSEPQSTPQTPIDSGPKKKISLKDYKTKDKSAINTPERKLADDIRRQAMKSHKEEVDAKLSGLDTKPDTKPVQEKKAQRSETIQKTPLPAPKDEPKPSTATQTRQDKESQRPVKKRKLSEEETKVPAGGANGIRPKEEPVERRPLPTLLSPDMPAPEKHQKMKNLPELLSRKLPSGLEKAMSAPAQRSDEVKAILKAGIGSPARSAEKKTLDGNGKDYTGNRVRSESQLSVKPTTATKATSPIARPLSSASNRGGLSNGQTSGPGPKQRHIVELRYGKKNIKNVKMLLRLPKAVEKEKTVSKAIPDTEPAKPDKKRAAEPVSDVPVKKPKLTATSAEISLKQERPSTPKLDVAGISPPQITKQKSTFSTPKKELKSVAMQRVASSDTLGVRTPSQEIGRTSTPLAVSHSSQPKTSPAPTSTPARGDEYLAWTDINTRVFQIGRALKKDGTHLAAEGKGKEQVRGVVLLIEGLVCFMLNSAAQAQARPGADPGWSTILPYHIMVWKQSRPHRHLHGLVVQLGAVCRQYLNYEQIKRLSKETLPDDHPTSAPTPGSDGLTKGTDDSIRKQKSFLELRDEIVQNSKELRTAWLDGPRLLPPDVIEEQYPKTWAKRAKDLSKRSPDRVSPKDIGKDFYIPIDVTTTVFEASNFALAFLHEWTLIEGVQWKTQVDLGPS